MRRLQLAMGNYPVFEFRDAIALQLFETFFRYLQAQPKGLEGRGLNVQEWLAQYLG
jgi:hypothetical protein